MATVSIHKFIYEIRGLKVMLDSDLARLYEVPTHRLNEAVKRNKDRFPEDFMFQLTNDEWEKQRSQFAIFVNDVRKYKPYAFTEQGVAMLSSVVGSKKAIEVNISIMRVFVNLRRYVLTQGTSEQIAELRKLLLIYIEKNDKRVNDIIIALNSLLQKPPESKRKIGFIVD